ncbi:TldD/PmbA family protein [Clostridium sp. 'deep sea']|uniref:TldD/PmbA family protein n=1 Tax=Clostridium sp. 'deep sea' TaxID=2779445 RepID=UPI00189687CB|nr:TldD/PmbA family protein [Clostridium sp. 'deep sea']QOR36521.1 TldD/PmbA family protein [Clostridium sp. 'deep sea']
MKQELKQGIELAKQLGASYADIRFTRRNLERINVSDESITGMVNSSNQGVGVRILYKNGWGFAGLPVSEESEIEQILPKAINEALAIAKASNAVNKNPIMWSEAPSIDTEYHTPVKIDPFLMKTEEKAEFLLDALAEAKVDPAIRVNSGFLRFFKDEKHFASTDNSYIYQTNYQTGGRMDVVATADGQAEKRHFRDHGTGGWELLEQMNFKEKAKTLGNEAVQLLSAESCPHEKTSLILGSSMVALQLHESCGHPTELDRALGSEATFAGTSFLNPEDWRKTRYGSEIVNINMDATVAGGLGTYGYDDEGIKAQNTPIIKDGIFYNYTTSRETAPRFGLNSNGAMLADGWSHIPLIRMTNICIEPSDWSLDEIIKDTNDGVFLDVSKSWSLDDKRMNFHFGCEIGYKIKDGEIVGMLKNNAYTDLTPHFWNSCDAIGNADEWHCWGRPSCAKGEPVQIANVGHGAAPIRLRDIEVGIHE